MDRSLPRLATSQQAADPIAQAEASARRRMVGLLAALILACAGYLFWGLGFGDFGPRWRFVFELRAGKLAGIGLPGHARQPAPSPALASASAISWRVGAMP